MTECTKKPEDQDPKKAAAIPPPSEDDLAEAQEWMRPGESPIDAYYRHKRELIDIGIGVPHYY